MSDFDVEGARKAGYSDTEIADHLATQRNFDVKGARAAGYSDADILSHLTGKAAPAPGTGVARVVGQGAIGVNDAIAGTVGAPVDAAAWALRKVGVPVTNPVGGSESIKKGIDYVATLPGRAADAVSQGSTAPFTEDRTSRFEPQGTVEKTARGVGEGVGNALSIIAPAGLIAKGAKAGSMLGGTAETLASQPVAQTLMAGTGGGVAAGTDNPWLGLAAGLAVPGVAGISRRAVSPVRNALSAQEQNLVRSADAEGIPLTAAQRTGSPTLKIAEATMASTPGSAGPMQEAFTNQRQQFNRANLERAGVTATDASPDTLTHAFTQQGKTFDDLSARTTLNVTPKFATDIEGVAQKYGRRLDNNVATVFQSYVDDLAPLLQAARTPGANPQVSGEIYKNIRSDLTADIRATSDGKLRRALGGLVDALDGAMESSSSGPLAAEWKDARREYQALMTIDKAMQGGTQGDRAAANIPFAALRGAVLQSDRSGYSRGRGQLNELSRVGDFLANKIPDSGTTARMRMSNPLWWSMIPPAYLGAKGYNNQLVQRYLTNQAAGPTNFNALYGGEAARRISGEGQ